MAHAVEFSYQSKHYQQRFRDHKAQLPVRYRDGHVERYCWGRRQVESGNLPLGGWAKLNDIHAKKWDQFFPKPIKLDVSGFMEMDLENNQHWFHLTKGQYIQGLFARYDQESRVYIVTIEPQKTDNIFNRWPRICSDIF